MNHHFEVNESFFKQLTDNWSDNEVQIYLHQSLSLITAFREKIKCYSRGELITLKNYIKAYLTIEQHSLIHKDYLYQIESQLKRMAK